MKLRELFKYRPVTVYYPLTEEDVNRGYVEYRSRQYSNKLMHTSLSKLKRFIIEEFGDTDLFPYYTKVQFDHDSIDHSIIGTEPGTVPIKIPFRLDLSGKRLKKL